MRKLARELMENWPVWLFMLGIAALGGAAGGATVLALRAALS